MGATNPPRNPFEETVLPEKKKPIARVGISPQALSQQRREVLLDAATREFLANGYAKTSLDAISRRSRVSKTTIYRHYADKAALFAAVVQANSPRIEQVNLDPETPAASLQALGTRIRLSMLQPAQRELTRALIAEYPHMPDTITHLRRLGIGEQLKPLVEFFAVLRQRGQMCDEEPERAATHFMVLASGNFRLLLETPQSEAEEMRLLQCDVAIFLRGFGIAPSAAATKGGSVHHHTGK
jgi:AcrR family transcriptional regulator